MCDAITVTPEAAIARISDPANFVYYVTFNRSIILK
jgi:hypothetical protein